MKKLEKKNKKNIAFPLHIDQYINDVSLDLIHSHIEYILCYYVLDY